MWPGLVHVFSCNIYYNESSQFTSRSSTKFHMVLSEHYLGHRSNVNDDLYLSPYPGEKMVFVWPKLDSNQCTHHLAVLGKH